jgi:hypothetical protein
MPSASLSRPTEALDTVERANELRRAVNKWATKAYRTQDVAQGRTYRRLASSYRKMLLNLLREHQAAA